MKPATCSPVQMPVSYTHLDVYKRQVHDIGKNIVKVILENYGFEVIDLGRDVPVETVVNTCLLYTSRCV